MFKELSMLNTRSYNSLYPKGNSVDNTLLGQGGGGGNFYQGPDSEPKDDYDESEDETDREETAVYPPFDPSTIQVVSVEEITKD